MNMNWYRFLQTLEGIVALLFAAGLVALLSGGADWLRAREMADWPSVPGVVTASETYSAEFRGMGARRAPAVRIAYAYADGDVAYHNERVGIKAVPVETNTAEGQRLLAQYPVGAAVTVYHDPDDPATAVLERDTPATAFITAAQLFALGAVVLALRWLWRKKPGLSDE